MKKLWWALPIGLIAAFLLFSKKNGTDQTAVKTIPVARGTVTVFVKSQGTVDVVEEAKTTIRARTNALVDRALAKEGELVRHRQPLLQYDRTEAEERAKQSAEKLMSASADLTHAEQEWSRANQLAEKKLETPQQLDVANLKLAQAKSAAAHADAEVMLAKNILDKLTCPAPHDGTVVAKYVESGQGVIPGQNLYLVADLKQLEIQCKGDEIDAASVALGQRAMIFSDSFPGRTFPGRVSEIGSRVIQEKEFSAVTIKIRVEDPQAPLKMGSTVDARIITQERRNVISIPTACLKTNGKRLSVFILEGSTTKEVPVTIGLSGIQEAEVTHGLREGQQVILNPLVRPTAKPDPFL